MRKELEYRQPGGAGTRQFIEILQLSLMHPMEALRRAVGTCVNRRVYSVAAVVNVLGNEPRRAVLRLDLSARAELSSVGDGIRSLSVYDQLATREAGFGKPTAGCSELVEGTCATMIEGVPS
jgi:hypothetical protein